MATLLIEIEDKKLKFFKELLQNLPFVKMREILLDEDTDEQVISNIRQGVKEMRLVEQGKMKSRSAREFLQDL
jgi:ethanolamine ammonia-lyase large subunit